MYLQDRQYVRNYTTTKQAHSKNNARIIHLPKFHPITKLNFQYKEVLFGGAVPCGAWRAAFHQCRKRNKCCTSDLQNVLEWNHRRWWFSRDEIVQRAWRLKEKHRHRRQYPQRRQGNCHWNKDYSKFPDKTQSHSFLELGRKT